MESSDRICPLPGDGERKAPVWREAFTVAALAVAASMLATADRARAEDATAGRQKALQCQGCHGLDGRAKIPGAPHIGGQVREYLAKSMRDYKSGARKDEMMAVVVRQLSDQDIEDLAAYYARLGAEANGER